MTACTRQHNPKEAMYRWQQRKSRSVLETTPSQKQFIGYICYNSQQRILHVYAVNIKHKHSLHTHQLLTLHSTEKAGIKLQNSSQKNWIVIHWTEIKDELIFDLYILIYSK